MNIDKNNQFRFYNKKEYKLKLLDLLLLYNKKCKPLHLFYKCNSCNKEHIVGNRYESNQFNNYNLCEKCKENLIHEHKFTKISDFSINNNNNNNNYSLFELVENIFISYFNIKDLKINKNIHIYIHCSRCKINPIIGKRYVCEICKKEKNFHNLCEKCFKENKNEFIHKKFKELKISENELNNNICNKCGNNNIIIKIKCLFCKTEEFNFLCKKCYNEYKDIHSHLEYKEINESEFELLLTKSYPFLKEIKNNNNKCKYCISKNIEFCLFELKVFCKNCIFKYLTYYFKYLQQIIILNKMGEKEIKELKDKYYNNIIFCFICKKIIKSKLYCMDIINKTYSCMKCKRSFISRFIILNINNEESNQYAIKNINSFKEYFKINEDIKIWRIIFFRGFYIRKLYNKFFSTKELIKIINKDNNINSFKLLLPDYIIWEKNTKNKILNFTDLNDKNIKFMEKIDIDWKEYYELFYNK